MSAEDNKALARRMYSEVINGGNLDLLDELVAEDFVEHEALPGQPTSGPAAPRAFFELFKGGFPDMQMTVDELIAEGDLVVGRATVTGTHNGEFMGIPPTGKSFKVQAIDIVRVRDGQFVEHWGVTDQAAMMEQLGLVEGPPG